MQSTQPVASKGAAGFVFCGEKHPGACVFVLAEQHGWNEIGIGREV
jgi:hypothetical protein